VVVSRRGGENRLDSIERLAAQARRGLARLDEGWRKLLLETVDEIRVLSGRSLKISGLLPDSEIGPTSSTSVQALMQLDHEEVFRRK
jgi:hypothetical protein